MMKIPSAPVAGVALLCVLAWPAAHATNGYFAHGYGLQAKGMGGAAVAVTQDAFGGANNPATMVWVGSRLDLGVDWFSPQRSASRSGSTLPTPGGMVPGGANFATDSDSSSFFVPELGYSRMLGSDKAVGLTIYGNGGMNTDYPGGTTMCGNALCGQGRLGVDLSQLIIAPTFSMKLGADHSVGVALLLNYQRFKAEGLQGFDNAPGFPPFTSAPGSVTNNGYDSSTGVGLRLGYLGKLTPDLQVGASYAPKTKMGKFDKYKGLFAEQGGFDIPANYGVGMAWQVTPAVQLALDYTRIAYSGVVAIGNPSYVPTALGTSNGRGFGWKDVSVVKVGMQWKLNQDLTLRAGYNHGSNPVTSGNVTFNILAPGVVQTHYTLGGTMAISPVSDLHFAFMHAMEQSVSGPSMLNDPSLFGPGNGGTETIKMHQNSLGIGWSMRF